MSQASRRQRMIFTLAAIFAAIFFSLIFNGGQCERYEKKMERQRLMRDYLDSQRREEQLKKLDR
jgi:hypothetical protein